MIGALIFLFPQFANAREWKQGANLEIWKYYDHACFAEFTTELRNPKNKTLLDWCRRRAKTHLNLTEPADYAFSGLFYDLLQFPLFSQHLGEPTQGDAIDSRPARNLAIFSQLLNKYEYLHGVNLLIPRNLNRDLQRLFNRFFPLSQRGRYRRI